MTAAPSVQRYEEYGGGEIPAFSWTEQGRPPARGRHARRAADGALAVGGAQRSASTNRCCSTMASTSTSASRSGRPAAASWSPIFGSCFTARSNWSRTWTCWAEAHIRLAEKWNGTLNPQAAEDEALEAAGPLGRGRREAARAFAFSKSLKLDARVLELEREFDRATHSLSWRLTAPLRAANRLRRDCAAGTSPPASGGSRPWRPPTGPAPRPRGRAAATATRPPRRRSTPAGVADTTCWRERRFCSCHSSYWRTWAVAR